MPTQFGWDDAKAASNEVKHGTTFQFATAVFLDGRHVDFNVSRIEDGEARRKAVGVIRGKRYCVVYTMRGETCWIISARRTNPQEDRLYDKVRS